MASEESAGQERAVERRRERAAMPPWEDMEHALERLLPRGWPRLWRGEWPSWADFGPLVGRVPRVDVIDRENEVVLRAEVPGLSKEDLEVSVSDRAVTLRGERIGTDEDRQTAKQRRDARTRRVDACTTHALASRKPRATTTAAPGAVTDSNEDFESDYVISSSVL